MHSTYPIATAEQQRPLQHRPELMELRRRIPFRCQAGRIAAEQRTVDAVQFVVHLHRNGNGVCAE